MRLTVKERILLHLLEAAQPPDAVEVSPAVTQAAVARGAGIELRHLAQFIRPLVQDALVSERTGHVTGKRQRMKVYGLTPRGRASAISLRERTATEVVQVHRGADTRDRVVGRRPLDLEPTPVLLETVQHADNAGLLELEPTRRPTEGGVAEQLWDAPRPVTFLGRRAELAEITREDRGPRVFVIRGIAGIGKSALAARACEVLRGQRNLFWHRVRPWESDLTILASLGHFLEALDRPGLTSVLRRGEPALAADVLRQDLPDTHALLVLDDAHEASARALATIRMLAEAVASAPDVKMLVLTRRALAGFGVRSIVLDRSVREIELDGLAPEEAANLLTQGGDSAKLLGLGRRLAGHPLLLELIRSQLSDLPHAIRDVHRFIQEEVYRDLSDGERAVMKAASLYRVPVPRATLLSVPGSAYESILSLQDRSLLRFVGGERYEIHDTIRDFFDGILTEEERHKVGASAVAQLEQLAALSTASGDVLSSIACLSNAVRIGESPERLPELCEALGDAHRSIGDALAMSAAYRAALRLVSDANVTARLHRKMASAFEDWGQYKTAVSEMEAGFAALGGDDSVERGWLELIRTRTVTENVGPQDSWSHALAAREVFRKFRVPGGEAEALLEMGASAALAGRLSEDGSPQFVSCFASALELASSVPAPLLVAKIHVNAAAVIAHGLGEIEEAWSHLAAVEASPEAMADPFVRAMFLLTRAWVELTVVPDYVRGESDLLEAERIARRTHDTKVHGNVVYLLSIPARHKGRFAEAARYLTSAGSECESAGLTSFAVASYVAASAQFLVAGDRSGYREAEAALHSLRLAEAREGSGMLRLQHQGLDDLIRGDVHGFETQYREFFRLADVTPALSYPRTGVWWGHFYYAAGLRALGRQREAEDHLRQARTLLQSFGNRLGLDLLAGDFGDRVTRSLRDFGVSPGTPSRLSPGPRGPKGRAVPVGSTGGPHR